MNSFSSSLLFLLLLLPHVSDALRYRVNATIRCRHRDGTEEPYQKEAIIQLWEEDVNLFGGLIDGDDLLAETKSSPGGGSFTLVSTWDEWELELEPYILIHHTCDGEIPKGENCTLISRMDLQHLPETKVLPSILLGANSQLKTWEIC